MKPIALHMEDAGISADQLAKATGLDRKLVQHIVSGNYVAGPSQRKILADALDVEVGSISWGHGVPVQHLRGNGPQTGRDT